MKQPHGGSTKMEKQYLIKSEKVLYNAVTQVHSWLELGPPVPLPFPF